MSQNQRFKNRLDSIKARIERLEGAQWTKEELVLNAIIYLYCLELTRGSHELPIRFVDALAEAGILTPDPDGSAWLTPHGYVIHKMDAEGSRLQEQMIYGCAHARTPGDPRLAENIWGPLDREVLDYYNIPYSIPAEDHESS